MVWTLLLLLFSYSPGAMSKFTLTQEPYISASPGEAAKLSCNISSGKYFGTFSWYQQQGGERPRFLLYYNTTSRETKFGPEASGHFSASTNTPKKTAFLTINNAQAKDEGDYYCYVGWVFGGGTQLTVTGQDPVSPSVQVFGPSEQEIKTQKKATLVCLLSGFHPPAFELKWKVDGTETTSGVETTKATKQGDKYLASSYLTRSDSNYGDHTYVCEVKHNGETFTKALTGSGSC